MRVDEPSVEATISILRGLTDRYEAHHGVRVSDAALISAAQLSDRYITTRFLPDKAIDLIDEACATRRVQLDSRPEEIDVLERKILQAEIESAALGREKDKDSKKRRKLVQEDIANWKEELAPLKTKWEEDKTLWKRIRPGNLNFLDAGTGAATGSAEQRPPDGPRNGRAAARQSWLVMFITCLVPGPPIKRHGTHFKLILK